MAENKLVDMSTEFAIQILKLTENIKGHYSLSNQLERSGTSIGANIREAKYAHSRPDFIVDLVKTLLYVILLASAIIIFIKRKIKNN